MKIELPSVTAPGGKAALRPGEKERVLLVIDVSGSMGSWFIDNQNDTRLEAAVRSIETIVRQSSRATSELGLMSFDSEAKVLQTISSSFTGIVVQSKNLRPGSSTSYVQALGMAANQNPHRLIFLSDGQPNEREEEVLRVTQTLADLGIKIDCVGIGEAGDLLKKMATLTGGVYAYADTVSDLVNTFGQLESRARLRLTGPAA